LNPDGAIYLGGDFTRINGAARQRVARRQERLHQCSRQPRAMPHLPLLFVELPKRPPVPPHAASSAAPRFGSHAIRSARGQGCASSRGLAKQDPAFSLSLCEACPARLSRFAQSRPFPI
jgi:hypothetical protein